ncbi:MAG TPA: hypothetical protein VIV57_13115 [Anaeromyxobacter sp.]
MFPLLAALLLAAAPAGSRPAESRPAEGREGVERRREAVAREIAALGAQIRRAIEKHDVAALVARVPEDGLRCGDRVVPRARVERDLRNEGSWIHGVVFGGPGYGPPPGTAPSLAALFRTAREIALVVSFQQDARAGPEGRPCLEFRAKEVGTPGPPLCFERRGEAWWLAESLYPCG